MKDVLELALEALRQAPITRQSADAIAALESAIKQRGEPVGEAEAFMGSNGGFTMVVFEAAHVPVGTKLYTSAPIIPEGWQLVPIEPTEQMFDNTIDAGTFDEDDVNFFWGQMLSAAPEYKGD